MAYTLNPVPQLGSGAFGSVPGVLGLPNPSGDLSAQLPRLGQLNNAASSDILSNLEGGLSPATMNALKNASATFGAASGMPGSGLSWNSLFGNIAGASTAEQNLGLQQYNSLVPTVSQTQTVAPGLESEIAGTNASNAAAPNPGASASYAASLFQQYLNQLRNPAGGGAGLGSPASDPLTGIPNWNPQGNGQDPYSVQSYAAGTFSNLGNPGGS